MDSNMPEPVSVNAASGTRPKIAIVSTFNELCGIAGYTKAVRRQLSSVADVTVFDLDQYLLRNTRRPVIKLAEKHINEIAAKLPEFDAVNIQLEHGTFGKTPDRILSRLSKIVKASPRMCITFHTILDSDNSALSDAWHQALKGRIDRALALVGMNLRGRVLSFGVYRMLRKTQKKKDVAIIVHNKRDMRLLRDVYGLKGVEHHPLAYMDELEVDRVKATVSRTMFPTLAHLPEGTKFVGTFGFLSRYKGFETAIRAMYGLPDNYHLLIFGGVHPQGIRKEEPIDKYVDSLIKAARIDVTVARSLKDTFGQVNSSGDPASLIMNHPQNLNGRIHFMGALSDDDFAAAMAYCDSVVLPYLEVGQSSSGPVAIALEMKARVIASRTLAFMQYEMYHKGQIEFFDIGNFVHLAQLIGSDPAIDPDGRHLEYNVDTNRKVYLKALGFEPQAHLRTA
ncbi:hypothetical protein AruPA_20520 [Acidiphilium sp. PA]|uniref:hypothetical protein n=1 Tax=Acidiphilium sp. PA TaxID=2871705 RepID=UPI002244B6B7|nr:hypothetical protein [Acidiphilium sp. PA]MCW8309407.1 hypothetical protein [Acidiphilium sp. PA]